MTSKERAKAFKQADTRFYFRQALLQLSFLPEKKRLTRIKKLPKEYRTKVILHMLNYGGIDPWVHYKT
jgi:Mg2+/Co2+ transporter CorC